MGWERCLLTTWMDENGVQRKRHEQVLELQLVGTEYFVGAAGEHGVLGRACLLRCRRRRRKDHSSRLLLVQYGMMTTLQALRTGGLRTLKQQWLIQYRAKKKEKNGETWIICSWQHTICSFSKDSKPTQLSSTATPVSVEEQVHDEKTTSTDPALVSDLHKGRLKKIRHLPCLKCVCNFLSELSALLLHIYLQLHIQINLLFEFNLLFGALGMAMGPNQGLTKEHSKFPAEKINIFFVTFFRVEISIIGLTIGCVGSLPSRSTYKWMILNDLCSQIWNKNSYLGGCQQIKVCARKWPRTTAGIVIYIFFKKSLYSSHQRRHSEVRCASRADLHKMLWALLCCVASNERCI